MGKSRFIQFLIKVVYNWNRNCWNNWIKNFHREQQFSELFLGISWRVWAFPETLNEFQTGIFYMCAKVFGRFVFLSCEHFFSVLVKIFVISNFFFRKIETKFSIKIRFEIATNILLENLQELKNKFINILLNKLTRSLEHK